MTTLPSVGGAQETVCLRLDLVNGWLFGIDAERVKPESRDLVIAYQEECYSVLFRHFYGRGVEDRTAQPPHGEPALDDNVVVKKSLVTEARHTFSPQAARELWFKLGMPTVPSMFADPRQGEMFHYTAIKKDPPPDDKKAA